MPVASILLPTHNRADVLGHAIASVLQQTEPDFELLIVADGCTEETRETIRSFTDPRIRVFDLPKAPHYGYANRNIALREARGEYVAFAADDDLLFPDHLQRLVGALETTGAEWVYSRPLWVSTDGVIVPFCTNLGLSDELQTFLTQGNTIPASCVVYRRACMDRYGYWPEDVPRAADWKYWIAIIEGGRRKTFTYLRTPTCVHFSAIWKHSRHSLLGEVETCLAVADHAGWWPTVLRYTVGNGQPEQAVIFESMQAGGLCWCEDVRAAVETVVDRMAWDDIRVVRPRLRALEEEVQRHASHAAESRRRVQELEARLRETEVKRRETESRRCDAESRLGETESSLKAMTDSTSWRITAPVRTTARALRRILG